MLEMKHVSYPGVRNGNVEKNVDINLPVELPLLAVLELPGVVGAVVEARHDGRVRVAQAAVVGGLAEVQIARRRDQTLLQDGLGVTLEEANCEISNPYWLFMSTSKKKGTYSSQGKPNIR